MQNLVTLILPCFAASLCHPRFGERLTFTQALTCVQSIVDLSVISQFESHTNRMIQYFEQYMKDVPEHKDLFVKYGKDKCKTRNMRAVTTRIRGENSEVLNQRRLSGDTVAKRKDVALQMNNVAI